MFLHGIGSVADAWAPQVEAFKSTRSVITPEVELSIQKAVFALDALEIVDADLCGLSWGSLVALRYTVDRPERVSRLILTAGFASLPLYLRVFQYAMSAAVQVIPRAPHHLGAPMREGARFDVRRSVERLQTPTLVLCGDRDRVNLRLSRTLAALLPNARFETIPDAGHIANRDNPTAFNRAVAAFVDSPADALCIPTAMHANPDGAGHARRFISGRDPRTPM